MAAKKPSSARTGTVAAARGRARASSSGAWELAKSIAGAIAIFLFVRAFLVEAYRIPSGSMIPTLLVGDWLFVNKLAYGPHVPFTDWSLPGYDDPERGDVVVFESPPQRDQPWDPTPTLVKRLVGVPGDTLHMRDGLLYVNGVPSPQPGWAVANPVDNPEARDPLFGWQREFGLAASRFGAAPASPTLGTWGPIVVPPGHYFMLGDNRYRSKDSRYWGLVPRENIRGRPLFVYFSIDWPERDVRWSRIGEWIR